MDEDEQLFAWFPLRFGDFQLSKSVVVQRSTIGDKQQAHRCRENIQLSSVEIK
jgi:hypothetical protein